jgi:hypothetical protein
MKKIFFSWQSDNKPVRNKIQKALQIAVKEVGKEIVEADRPELDSDTQGTFSSEEIMDTIFNKIESSSIFIADATPIANTKNKLIPNPNVMAEIGYALKVMGPNTKLFVYASDDPKAPDKMPFDIRGKKLFRIDISKSPKQIAEDLMPYLNWMLEQAGNYSTKDDYPLIYADGATWTNWANGTTATFSIRNADDKQYLLEAIELAGYSAEPFRALKQNETTSGVVINGVDKVFDAPNPTLKMTVSRNSKKYRLEQTLLTQHGADDRHHFAKFIESSSPVLY